MRDRAFVRRHDMHAAREGRTDVRDGRFAIRRIQGRQLHRDVRACRLEKVFDRVGARPECRMFPNAVPIDGRAVAERVDSGNAEGKFAPLRPKEPRQRAPDVPVTDEREVILRAIHARAHPYLRHRRHLR